MPRAVEAMFAKIVRTGPHVRVTGTPTGVRRHVLDLTEGTAADGTGAWIVHGSILAPGTHLAPLTANSVEEMPMESIQVPDEIAIQEDMHEVQIHLKWDQYDIALPLTVARLVADATTHLVEQVGGPLTAQQREELRRR